jgi:hypothetical protein
MEGGYFVVARDGNQYGPVDRDTVQTWYLEGRVDQNSRVWEPGGHKFRLHEMFDLTVWRNPNLVSQASQATGDRGVDLKSDIYAVPSERTPGMLAAAMLLLGGGLIELLAVAALAAQKVDLRGNQTLTLAGAAIVDIVVAIGLFRGNQRFRGWGLARAVLGGIFLIIGGFGTATTIAQGITVGFQVIMCAGIALLLAGESPSKVRVASGVAAVLLAWSGIITTGFVEGFTGALSRGNQEAVNVPGSVEGAAFSDDKLGVSVKLPSGWALLNEDNQLVRIPDAAMIAVHGRSGCFAALRVEQASLEQLSLDGYLQLVLLNRRQLSPSLEELSRSDLVFGGNPGRRLETSWSVDGKKFRGFTTACRAGGSYYLLTGWCIDEAYQNAFAAYQVLESAFQVNGTGAGDYSSKGLSGTVRPRGVPGSKVKR